MNPGKIQSLQPSLSREILGRFIGMRVARLVRYSWWKKENVSSECGVANEQAFSLTAGPLAVVFEDGSTLGVASDPSLNSVIVWVDRFGSETKMSPALDEDTELFPIDSIDEIYAEPFWKHFKNTTLTDFSILKKKSMSAGERELPSELGLHFHFDGNEGFVAAHGLHNGSDDFSVLKEEQIGLATCGLLEELALL